MISPNDIPRYKLLFERFPLFFIRGGNIYFKKKFLPTNYALSFSFDVDKIRITSSNQYESYWLLLLFKNGTGMLKCKGRNMPLEFYHQFYNLNIDVITLDDYTSIKRKWQIDQIII